MPLRIDDLSMPRSAVKEMGLQKVPVGKGSFLIGKEIVLGKEIQFGANTVIRSMSIRIGDHTVIGDHNQVLMGDSFEVGSNTVLGHHNSIIGRQVILGDYIWWGNFVEVGQGGKFGPNSILTIGSFSMVCDRVLLNISERITIGEHVGIGGEVNIWTHGGFLPTLEGFPCDFGPVTIGSKVWLPARCVVLPKRTIGSNVVISINSLINRNIPDNCLAAGMPVRIVRENYYPRFSEVRNTAFIHERVTRYKELASYKELKPQIEHDAPYRIRVNQVLFDLKSMTVEGELGPVEEDFRDYLRRCGIKFFTGKNFSSIQPPNIRRLLEVPLDE